MTKRLLLSCLLLWPAFGVAEDLYVDCTTYTSNNLTGSCSTQMDGEDPDSADGTWLTATTCDNTDFIVDLDDPSGTPTGTQTFAVRVRETGAGSGQPTLDCDVYALSTKQCDTTIAGTTITSTTGEIITGTWTWGSCGLLSLGSTAQMFCRATKGGGGPNCDAGEFDSAEWQANIAATGARRVIRTH
jgi:hypothetical protein